MMRTTGRPARTLIGALLLPLLVSCADTSMEPAEGIPMDLADRRSRTISDVAYTFRLDIPRDPDAPIHGSALIELTWTDPDDEALIVDLEWAEDRVEGVRVDGRPVNWHTVSDRLVVPADVLRPHARNRIEVDFVSRGDAGVRRDARFAYSLFVPDRAHELLPLFDQPDLKGRVSWVIEAPLGWEVATNGALAGREARATTEQWTFSPSPPISTYLMAFAAGTFDIVEGTRRGRTYRLMHLALDAERVDRNAGAVFDLHARSLAWMESYTGVEYPFGKFDIVAVPDLPYAGMEHPGVVLYRERDLLPAGETSLSAQRRRAEIVAHESAHMWFGNLVTMAWLDDLWMKEVFAVHFATRVLEDLFPEDDRDLRFLLANHPAGYPSDRAGDARPIRRTVTNRHDGSVPSGPGLHRRASIALANLERFVSPTTFRDGVRDLLHRHAWGSAGWDDFLAALHPLHDGDLSDWTRTWMEGVGRPVIRLVWEPGGAGTGTVALVQEEGANGEISWPQRLTVFGAWPDRTESSTVEVGGAASRVVLWENVSRPEVVIPNASGLEYGIFRLEPPWTDALVARLGRLRPALLRGAATLVIEDALAEGRVAPEAVIEAGLAALETEAHDLLATRLVRLVGSTYQDHLAADREHPLGARIRDGFGDRMARARSRALNERVASAWQQVVLESRIPGRISSTALAVETPVVRLSPR